jgi:hypothetical protein
MKSLKNKIAGILVAIAVVFVGWATYITKDSLNKLGNISILPVHSNCKTATATTSVNYISAGNATTTLTCDAYNMDDKIAEYKAIDSATLAIQFIASTSASILNTSIEYSTDGIDWFENNLSELSTTTYALSITTPQTITLSGNTTSSTTRKIVSVETPTRYVRAVFTVPVGAASSSIWAEFIPKIEVN